MNIIVHYPQSAEKIAELQKCVATVHIEAVTTYVNSLSCPKSQKQSLLDALIHYSNWLFTLEFCCILVYNKYCQRNLTGSLGMNILWTARPISPIHIGEGVVLMVKKSLIILILIIVFLLIFPIKAN